MKWVYAEERASSSAVTLTLVEFVSSMALPTSNVNLGRDTRELQSNLSLLWRLSSSSAEALSSTRISSLCFGTTTLPSTSLPQCTNRYRHCLYIRIQSLVLITNSLEASVSDKASKRGRRISSSHWVEESNAVESSANVGYDE